MRERERERGEWFMINSSRFALLLYIERFEYINIFFTLHFIVLARISIELDIELKVTIPK